MKIEQVRQEIRDFLRFSIPEIASHFTTLEHVELDNYRRLRISYTGEEADEIPAYLLEPEGDGPFGAVLVHHQHASQRHFGKSEVCGLAGDPLQAFGPALARAGLVVLAPDSICFEDRRRNRSGTEADEDADIAQHYNEMCYRLVRGDTLMRKVLSDSALGISILGEHPKVDRERIGMLGHSYGGNTVLFHGALDERVRLACSSGAACSYQHKMENQIGIEMAEAIPGFVVDFDISDLVTCFVPRPLLIISATEDKSSQDANTIVAISKEVCRKLDVVENIEHTRFKGGHRLTQERFDTIVSWLVQCGA